jgi:hypothetical protein
MSKKTFNDTLRQLLVIAANPIIRPYIDTTKLIKSKDFSNALEIVVENFCLHRDTGPINRILLLLDGSKHQQTVADWFREKLNISISRSSDGFTFQVPKKVKTSTQKFSDYLIESKNHIPGTIHPKIIKEQPPRKMNIERNSSKTSGYLDALDHPARLPGSFGSGRRR